jgi:predicted transcriptional regulator
MNSNENDPHLTAKIVCQYVAHHKMASSQLSELIATVHQAIGQLGQPAQVEEVRTPAVSVRRSVQHDYVVCLDCGYRGKTLRRHINVRHGLNRDEYLRRWRLKSDHPLTAPAYSERRSAMSKALGFGRRSTTRVAQAATPVMTSAPIEAEAKPIPRRRARPASKSAAAGTNPVAKARTRRARRVSQQEKNASPTAET